MKSVRIDKDWDSIDLLRQTPSSSGKWGELNCTLQEIPNMDYYVTLNFPKNNSNIRCLKNGKILITQEPPYERYNHFKRYFRFFDKIYTQFEDNKYQKKIIKSHGALSWLVDKTYDELVQIQPMDFQNKIRKVSWITSNKSFLPGHSQRLAFLDYISLNFVDLFDIYGQGIKPINDKFDGIYPYPYSLAIENYVDDYYWSEKIADVFLSWSMPIYYGCKKILDFFPKESIILIDINKPEEALRIIQRAMDENLYERNLEYIKEARELVLNKYQLFPFLDNIIKNDLYVRSDFSKIKSKIPANGLTFRENILSQLKSNLRRK